MARIAGHGQAGDTGVSQADFNQLTNFVGWAG
jgi:hypothetical protein